MIEYLEGNRKVELELTLDFIGQLGPSIDRVTSTFIERSQFAGHLIIRLPGFEPIAMADQEFAQQIGIGPIILGATTEEGFTIISQLAGIDRIKLKELIRHQLVNERSSALFKADQHFTFCTEAFVHLSDPIV